MRLIDIHTHGFRANHTVTSYMVREYDPANRSASGFITLGVHPWELDPGNPEKEFENQFAEVRTAAEEGRILAIGECGIDRRKVKIDPELQKLFFVRHVKLAEEFALPLIIHSVRAHSDVLSIRKLHKKTPWLIHGFFGSRQELEDCLRLDVRISPGLALQLHMGTHSKKLTDAIRHIPDSSLFLETDGISTPISEIYRMVSEIRGQSVEELARIVAENFNRDFLNDQKIDYL